jgi:uncharacterized protein (UPF0261 family)
MPAIAILATLDTKADEARYLQRLIRERGWLTAVLDVGLGEAPEGLADVTAESVACAAGTTLRDLRAERRRDRVMEAMGRGAGRLLVEQHQAGTLAAAIAVGGNQGTAIASIALRALPIGLPKLIVSTVASGNVRSYVGDSDIAMLFSVGDLLGGPNVVTGQVLRKAAGAIVGMAASEEPSVESHAATVGITAFGNTHQAVTLAMNRLRDAGCHVVPFHASGASGSAMERLLVEGRLDAVLDLTTHELLGELYPDDSYTPIRPRLVAAGARGRPQVIAPGGLEYFCFGPPSTIPSHLRHRATHYHNPYNTNVRTSREELRRVGVLLAERLNQARGPVALLIPLQGWSEVGSPGGILHDPDANAGLLESVRHHLKPSIPVKEVDMTINDPAFAELAAETLLGFLKPVHQGPTTVDAARSRFVRNEGEDNVRDRNND